MLDIQHDDQTKGALNLLPFSFICGSQPCHPGNIQIGTIKKELQEQNVTAEDYILRLKGSAETLSWDLRSMCLALTIWHRKRSDSELDVPFLLISRDARNLSTRPWRGRTGAAVDGRVDTPSNCICEQACEQAGRTKATHVDSWEIAENSIHKVETPDNTQTNSSWDRFHAFDNDSDDAMVESSAEDQIPGQIKRLREETPIKAGSDNESSQVTYRHLVDVYEAGN